MGRFRFKKSASGGLPLVGKMAVDVMEF